MIAKVLLDAIRQKSGVKMADPIGEGELRQLLNLVNIPNDHQEVLRTSNGLTVYHGYYRLFGISQRASIDMLDWNAPARWKFAWPKELDDYWFFGETAWGDQYAYKKSELQSGQSPSVYLLDALAMESEVFATDFEAFFENEILRNASIPYDSYLVKVRKKLGDLMPSEHIVYGVSPLIVGRELLDTVYKMNSVASMIAAGDIYAQMADEDGSRTVKEVRIVDDSQGRPRLRVIWNETTH